MVPAHCHDVDGNLSDHNVGKISGLSKILMLHAHFHDVAGDLFTIVEKFWDCPKFWLLSHRVMLLKFLLYSFSVRDFS